MTIDGFRQNGFRQIKRSLLAAALALVLMLCSVPQAAQAYPLVDVSQRSALTINYPVAGVSFRLYKVGDISAQATFTVTGQFRRYPIDITGLTSSGWLDTAKMLADHAACDKLTPTQTGQIQEDHLLTFDNLSTGLYLLVGDRCTTEEGDIYTPTPCLISLPGMGVDGGWNYTPKVTMKYSQESKHLMPAKIDLQARKLWRDNGDTSQRPHEVTVQLLQDGEVYDTKVLNAANGWQCSWPKLDNQYAWSVLEKDVAENYTVLVSQEGSAFVIINTYHKPDNPPPDDDDDDGDTPPGKPENPPDNPPGNPPDTPDTPDLPPTPETFIPDDEPPLAYWESPDLPDDDLPEELVDIPGNPVPLDHRLPQTGMLWWPVPLLSMFGLTLIAIGLILRRREAE